MRALRIVLLFAALAPALAHAASEQCVEQVLADLGWSLSSGPIFSVDAGAPCDRASLADARAARDLRATLPPGSARTPALAALLHHPATGCAFRLRLADASRDAVGALVANERFRFFSWQARWIAFDADARQAWQPVASFGRAWRPRAGNHAAIATFLVAGARAECGVGRQVAQYVALAALFGADGFDVAFARDEIVLGTFTELGRSRSVLLGSGAGALARDGLARNAAQRGRAALLAAPAFLFAHDRGRVEDIANQAQNGVIHAVDDTAAAALRGSGSLAGANAAALRAWQLARGIERRGPRWFQRLLAEDDARAWALLDDADQNAATAARDALTHPVLAGISFYGHPHGAQPLRWWLARMLDRNPGTPYRFELGNHNLDGEIRERWVAWRLSQCVTNAPDPRPAPSGLAPRTAPATHASTAAPSR